MRLAQRSTVALEIVIALAVLAAALSLVPRGGPRSEAAQLTSGGFTTGASVTPGSGAPGSSFAISAAVTSSTTRSALVDVEVYGPGGRVHQQFFDGQSFSAGQQRTFAVNWNAPASAPLGAYTVKIGVFATGWSALLHWNDGAAAFSVVATATPTPTATGALTATASVSPATIGAGGSVSIAARITSPQTRRALIDIEVFAPNGTRVHQRTWDNRSLSADTPRTFTTSWTTPDGAVSGAYIVKVGVFGTGWSGMLAWNDLAATFSVTGAGATPTPTATPSATPTATASPTASPTASATPSATPSPTASPTPTPTPPATPTATPTPTSGLPALPARWPSRALQLGAFDSPGGASTLRQIAPFGFRYQYLAGGVNTGSGWANWNPGGNFATYYIQDSVANNVTPVFTYYMIYQSAPGNSMSEIDGVNSNLQNTATMTAYFSDLKLLLQRSGAFSQPVVVHIEPDMWAYAHHRATADNATTVPAKVAATGLAELAGLPNNLAGVAQGMKRLRDQYAPNVILAYHLSVWGSQGTSGTGSGAVRSANFYRSLGADFDVVFHDLIDRDAGFYQYVYGDGGRAWWGPTQFANNVTYIRDFVSIARERVVLWQLPLGNTRMRAMNNTWNHYQDNRVEWFLDEPARTHLRDYANAGVIALMFGRGADGTTCACDANNDGVTNPAPINGNTGDSLNADDDGGFFRQKSGQYYTTGAYPLP
jgi:hypothetical protein